MMMQGCPARTRSHDHTHQWHYPGNALFKNNRQHIIIATIEVCSWHARDDQFTCLIVGFLGQGRRSIYTTPVVFLYLDRLNPWLTDVSYTRTWIPNSADSFTRPRVA